MTRAYNVQRAMGRIGWCTVLCGVTVLLHGGRMAVADDKQIMQTKSTWFEPKLSDGLVTHVLD